MYIEQRGIIDSPLQNPPIRELAKQLSPILGDSAMLTNIALLYLQHVLYKSIEDIQSLVISLTDNISPDLYLLYSMHTTNVNDIQKNRILLQNQMLSFIEQTIKFYQQKATIQSLIQHYARQNLYFVVDRVIDDDYTAPYIELAIRRI